MNGKESSLFSGNKDKKKKKLFGKLTGRQKAVGGGLLGALVGLIIGLFSILQGPLQFIHLSQILSKFSRYSDNSISIRTKSLFKYHRYNATGDIGETRVGFVGSRQFAKVTSQLDAKGITIQRNTPNGRPSAVIIDASKNPGLRGVTQAQTEANIARHFGLETKNINRAGSGYFEIDVDGLNSRRLRMLTSSTLGLLEDGKIQTAMNKRVIGKFWNAPSLFHPLQRGAADLQNRWDTRVARITAEKERKNQDSKRAKLKADYENARQRLATRLSGASTFLSGALTVTGGLCVVKGAADLLPAVNYANVVVPAKEEAIDKIAIGSQVQTGDDFDMDILANVQESLVDDEGRSIWSSQALNALEYGGKGDGYTINPGYKQAFTYDGGSIANLLRAFETEDAVNEDAVREISNEELENADESGAIVGGIDATADTVCSPLGLVAQGIAGVGLVFLGPGGWVVKSAQTLSSAAVFSGIIYTINQMVSNLGEDMIEDFGGPQGGNLLAYGARASANMNARSMGGVALSESDELALWNEFEQREREEFMQRSFFARTFDVYENRSVASNLLRKTPPPSRQSISNIAHSLVNPFNSLFSSISSVATPRALADEGNYNWGFPIYSIPPDVLENETYEDPYENAVVAERILQDELGDADDEADRDTYTGRAEACFGVRFQKDSNGWDVIPTEEVNPLEETYQGEDCSDMSDSNWVRMMLFVFDTSILTTIECYEGETAACQKIGIGNVNLGGGAFGAGEIIDGFAFPMEITKSGIGNSYIFSNGTTNVAGHPYTAYDIYAPVGTPVLSSTEGVVSRVNNASRPCGDGRIALSVQIYHEASNRTYFYQHMAPGTAQVSEGQIVSPGQVLGTLGDGGAHCNTVPHIHIDAVTGQSRPACRRGSCPASTQALFIDIGPSLYQTYQTLPE
jgi:lysozyme family protein